MTQRNRVLCVSAITVLSWLVQPANADELKFKPEGEGQFSFDTGVIHGSLSGDGKRNGIISLVHAKTGEQLAHGVGLLNLYRLFSSSDRYGDAARNWPVSARLLEDGAVDVTYPSANEHPFKIRTVYRLSSVNAIDLDIEVTPDEDMPRFELFQSSYFKPEMTGRIYVKPPFVAQGSPHFLSPDYHDMIAGTYLMFPRDEAAIQLIFDGRWRRPPHPVQWSISQWMAAPLAVRIDPASGVTAVVMAPSDDCFAVAAPYNRTPPDGIAAHGSIYFSLFGRDLAEAETARTRLRLVVLDRFVDQQVEQSYKQFATAKE